MSSQQSRIFIEEATCYSCGKTVEFKPSMELARFIGSSTDNYWSCRITDPQTGEKNIICPQCDYTGPQGILYVLTPRKDSA
jgi:ssDNA-binding Zn-finger/Zn-ribbon topoisomerase 1